MAEPSRIFNQANLKSNGYSLLYKPPTDLNQFRQVLQQNTVENFNDFFKPRIKKTTDQANKTNEEYRAAR